MADVLLDRLPELVKAERARRGARQSDVAAELGIQTSTICRLEKGTNLPDARGLLALIGWLRLPGWMFLGGSGEAVAAGYDRGWDDCAAMVARVLAARPDEGAL